MRFVVAFAVNTRQAPHHRCLFARSSMSTIELPEKSKPRA